MDSGKRTDQGSLLLGLRCLQDHGGLLLLLDEEG